MGYEIQYGSSSFRIEANENGIYLYFSVGRSLQVEEAKQPSIDPHNISDEEIHDWFGEIVSE